MTAHQALNTVGQPFENLFEIRFEMDCLSEEGFGRLVRPLIVTHYEESEQKRAHGKCVLNHREREKSKLKCRAIKRETKYLADAWEFGQAASKLVILHK